MWSNEPAALSSEVVPRHSILHLMGCIEGWLQEDEADLLMQIAALSLAEGPTPSLVEVGSYKGRSTSVLASVVKALRPAATVYSIDPHEGELSVAGFAEPQVTQPTASAFEASLAAAGLSNLVVKVEQRSWEVQWDRPVALLYIDGLHDRENVRRDFLHFEPWLFEGSYVAFHDYGDLWPEVREVVDELIAAGRLERLATAGSLVVLRSRGACERPATDSASLSPEGQSDPIDPDALLHLAQLAALSAGRLLLDRSQPGDVRYKQAPADLVTDADLEAERRIRTTIERHRPHDSILAEEGGEKRGATAVRWIVDALDGTVNYVTGSGDWAVAVAAEIRGGGGIVAGVVHAPRLRRTYSALRGAGAWCNDSPLPLRPCPEKPLDACLVATGFSPRPDQREVQAAQIVGLLPRVRDVRCRGAASLELCTVAAGEADAYWESDLHLWDVAAAGLVVSEAGASLLGATPPGKHPLIAARGRAADELAEALASWEATL